MIDNYEVRSLTIIIIITVTFITNIVNIIISTVIIITFITTFEIDMEIKRLIFICKKHRTYKKVQKWIFFCCWGGLCGRAFFSSEDHFLISDAVQRLSNDIVV